MELILDSYKKLHGRDKIYFEFECLCGKLMELDDTINISKACECGIVWRMKHSIMGKIKEISDKR